MSKASIFLVATFTFGLTACHDSDQRSGAAQDEAAANAAGVAYNGPGPAEQSGKAADHANGAVAKARDAQAYALTEQGRAIQSQSDVDANKLEA